MHKKILRSLAGLLLPFAAYGAQASYGAYQRRSISKTAGCSALDLSPLSSSPLRAPVVLEAGALATTRGAVTRELVIVDASVRDRHLILKQARPGLDVVEIKAGDDGVAALVQALQGYEDLHAVHVVAHAEAGTLFLGGHRVDQQSLIDSGSAFAALNHAIREGGDLLLYGCDLALGEDFLELLQQNTHIDIAASLDKTGNEALGGDWELEIQKGDIETAVLADSIALQDFSEVLFTGTINFSQTKNAGSYYGGPSVDAEVWATGTSGYFLTIDGSGRSTELYTALGSSGQAAFTLNTETSVTLRFNGNAPFSPQSLKVANIAGGGGTTHAFTFTSNKGSFTQNVVNGSPATVDLTSFGANVTYITISSTLVYAWMDDFSVVGVGITVDEDPPVFQNSTPSVGSQILSGATLSADLDEEGSVYYVVVADGAGAPSAAQVLAGQNSSGAAALASGNFTTTSTVGSEAFSALSSGTNYDLYAVAQDDEGTPNVQASPTLVNFTTQAADSDGALTAAGGVTEPAGLGTTVDTVGEAVEVFDFTISDGGTSDGLALTPSQIVVRVSGTSTDTERAKITWRLNGPDVSNTTGTYSAGADTITFSGLSVSVADGGNETYTVNAYFNNNTGLTGDHTIILSIDGDTDLTVGGSGTQMGSTSAVTNGAGTTIDVVATSLVFTTQPAGSASSAALTTQPVVTARDAFGNTDVDFTETITLTEASAGTLSNNTQAATSGVATFTNLIYVATADQQSFTLSANDQDGVGSNLPTVDSNAVTSDVVATKLLFVTEPSPLTTGSGETLDFTTDPVVRATDANDVTDTGYATGITLAEVNGAGSATMSATGDTDGSAATVSITPSSGVATFTNLNLTYTNSGSSDETFRLRASSGGLTTADSSTITSNALPVVTDGNISISGASGTGGAYKIGDTVTATWNNTSGGNNNSGIIGVTVDFSQFGGGAAVAATESSGTWTATYTITSGAVDAANRNVSVTATNAGGGTTTADTTNATVDNIAPAVSSVGVPANASYRAGENLDFTINTTQSVTVSTGGGTPRVALTIGASTRYAEYLAGSGSSALTFRYQVQTGDLDNDGIAVGSAIDSNGGTLRDASDNALVLTLNSVGSTIAVLVDGVVPSVSSVGVPANATYVVGDNLDFTVNFSESITVNTGGGTPRIALTLDTGGTVYAAYLSGSGTSAVIFRYTVDSGNFDATGIAVGALDANGGTLNDAAGNDATLTLNSMGSTTSVLVDGIVPSVSSINRQTPGGATTNETTLVYRVTFSESVTGVGVADFSLTSTGTASGTLDSVSANSGLNIDVTIVDAAGDGTLRLDLNAFGTGIADTATNGISGGYTSGQTYTIDNTAPSAPSTPDMTSGTDSGLSNSDNFTSNTTPTFTGTAEADSSVTLYDTDGTTVLGTATATGGDWSITSSLLAEGSHTITAKSNDPVGNSSAASSGLFVTIDTTAPVAPIITAITDDTGSNTTDQITSDTTLVLSGTSEANSSVTVFRNAAQIGTATANGSGAWSFDYTGTTLAGGSHTFTASATDSAGNVSATSSDFLVEIDVNTPATPVVAEISNDTGASSTDGITSDPTLVLSGTAEAGAVVTLSRGSVGVIGTSTANGSGAWTFDYTGTPLADGDYIFSAFATDTAGNASTVSADFPVTIDTTAPAIGMQPLGGTYVANDSFDLSVVATDDSALSYQWYLGGIVLGDYSNRSGSTTATVTHTNIGAVGFAGDYTVVVTDAAGNSTTSAAATIVVNQADQTITFPPISDQLTTSAPFTISATASTNFAVTFAVVSGPATVSGSIVTITGAGPVTIRASQAGDINTNAASADRTFTVNKATAAVTLAGLSHIYDGSARTASATTSPANLAVNFTYNGSATVPVNAGSYAVVATIEDLIYEGTQSDTLVIGKADQIVGFAGIGAVTVGSPVTLSATASSGLPVTFSVVSGNATVAGASFTANDANTIVLRASQVGSGNFNAASSDQTVVSAQITKRTQTITFTPPVDHATADAAFALSATASSGLSVSFAIESGPATLSGSTVTLTGAPGTVTVVASQAGNDAYDAAPSVTRSFAVTSPAPLTGFGPFLLGGLESGRFGLSLARDGASGTLVGFIPGEGGLVCRFAPDTSGSFIATCELLMAGEEGILPGGVAAAPVIWTIHGQIQGTTLTATIVESGISMSATFDPVGGATAAQAGYYLSSTLDTTIDQIHAIVGTAGSVFVLAVLDDLVEGDEGAINGGTGDVVVTLPSGVVIDANVDAPSATVDGAVIRPSGGETTDFTGLRSDTSRTDRLINLSSRAHVGAGDNIVITGFVISGAQPKSVLLRAVGPGLTPFGITAALGNPRLRVFRGSAVIAENDDWSSSADAVAIADAAARVGAFTLDSPGQDAAVLLTLQPGSYTVQVDGAGGQGVALAEIYDASANPADEYQRLANISTRGLVGAGEDTLIGGFIVTGNAPKRVLVRGVGPALQAFGLEGALADPRLSVVHEGAVIAQNDDWGAGVNTEAELVAAASTTGAFALTSGSGDAALLLTLAPGIYTAQVAPPEGASGIALIEIYELP